jgi:cellulose synthase/poly-beta-1,6-N-acetylglucosamine synthase-like glycosyltransferase
MTDSNASEPAIHRIPAVDGADPLVGTYLEANRVTCAWVVLSWLWLLLTIPALVAGALIGDAAISGSPEAPLWVREGSLAWTFNAYLGWPWAVLGGMAIAATVMSILGALIRPKRVPAVQEPWMVFTVFAPLYLLIYDPLVAASIITAVLCSVYVLAMAFRLLALLIGWDPKAVEPAADDENLPVYTVLVPLYREEAIAEKIVGNLGALDYPRDKLDVKLLLEADDPATMAAIEKAGIPDWCEVLVVPDAQPKTKPRACNHGLARARGEFLVIFDAEDKPEPDQLRKAVAAFRQSKDSVVCLQARLAYHNFNQNLLTRFFALEYNVWFQRYLDGLCRLGGPIPLGGTSNHFKTQVLREMEGWDPFNVTEDCDLGIRIAMSGKQVTTLDSITWEEANSRVGNWVRQRSRWLKGYLVTHLVWARRPLWLVWKLGPLGACRFFLSIFGVAGLAVLNLPLWIAMAWYVTAIAVDMAGGMGLWQILTTPNLEGDGRWSWALLYLGPNQDPFWSTASVIFATISLALFVSNILFILINAIFGHRKGQRGLVFPALISPLYWVLISIGAWKALWQLLFKPHHWEKTIHGLDEQHGDGPTETA